MIRPVDRLWIGRKLTVAAGDVVVFFVIVAGLIGVREQDSVQWSLLRPLMPLLGFTMLSAYAAGLYELRLVRDFVALVGGLLASSVACWVFGTSYFYLLSPHLNVAPR